MVGGFERKLHPGENISAVLPKSGQFQLRAQDRLRLGWSLVKDTDQGLTEKQFIIQNQSPCLTDLAVQILNQKLPLPRMMQPNKKAEGNYSALFDSILTCWITLKLSCRHPSTETLPEGVL